MLDLRLYLLQRLSALVMAPLVLVHLAVIIIAVQNGLTSEEILSRTQGSFWWALLYGTFVVAVSVHAAIGLRVIVFETLKLKGFALNSLTWAIFLGLILMGARAVWAVTAVGAT